MARAGERTRVPRAAARRRSGMVMRAAAPVVARVAARHGLVLWDVSFAKEAGDEVLRVAVDRPGGIDAEAIASLSEALSRELDAADAVPGDSRYYLEVTSPGAERKLKTPEQFGVCVGRTARLTFRSGREPLEGIISAVRDDAVVIDATDSDPEAIPFDQVSTARLTVPGA